MIAPSRRALVSLVIVPLLGLLGCLLVASVAISQVAASVSGIVRGPNGDPLPGARVVASGPALQLASVEATTDSGEIQVGLRYFLGGR